MQIDAAKEILTVDSEFHIVVYGLILLAIVYFKGKSVVELANIVRKSIKENIMFISKSVLFMCSGIFAILVAIFNISKILIIAFSASMGLIIYMLTEEGQIRLAES